MQSSSPSHLACSRPQRQPAAVARQGTGDQVRAAGCRPGQQSKKQSESGRLLVGGQVVVGLRHGELQAEVACSTPGWHLSTGDQWHVSGHQWRRALPTHLRPSPSAIMRSPAGLQAQVHNEAVRRTARLDRVRTVGRLQRCACYSGKPSAHRELSASLPLPVRVAGR